MKNAFTLIELLVVVLIIGILAAVALPNYRKAAAKSKIANMIIIAKSLKTSQDLYYMLNDKYSISFSELDLSFSCDKITSDSVSETCSFNNMQIRLFNNVGFYITSNSVKLEYHNSYGSVTTDLQCAAKTSEPYMEEACKSYGPKVRDANMGGWSDYYAVLNWTSIKK